MSTSRVALVTGGARGIGAAVVRRLAEAGWRVVAADSCSDDPRVPYPMGTKAQLASVAQAHPSPVIDVVTNVQDLDALREAAGLAESEFGGLDAAVAAGAVITGGQALWQTQPSDWDAMFDIGVHGVANLARAAIPAMLQREQPRSGRFVAIASAAAHRGLWHLSGYTAAKHAVVGLTKALAHDLRGTGITANAISPGSTSTDKLTASAQLYHLGDTGEFARHHLLERLLDPDEIAAPIAWLCSTDSSALTGAVVPADGGFTA